MKTLTLREKWAIAWADFKRFVKIIVLTVICTAIFAVGLCLAWSINENAKLKDQVNKLEKEKIESSKAEEKEDINEKVFVIEGTTYHVYTSR